MNYKNLLYSRSRNRGHRWILLPNFLTQEDVQKLQGLLWNDDFLSSLNPTDLVFSFCLMRTSQAYILARLRKTEYTDDERFGERPISCIDGIAVERKDAWFLRMALPWLLTEHINCLDSWRFVGFEDSEEFHQKDPSFRVFQLSILDTMPKIISESVDPPVRSVRHLEFDQAGFSQLVRYLYPDDTKSNLDLLQIGFGISDVSISDDFEIIVARAQKKSLSRMSSTTVASSAKPKEAAPRLSRARPIRPSDGNALPKRRSESDFLTRLYRFLHPNNEE